MKHIHMQLLFALLLLASFIAVPNAQAQAPNVRVIADPLVLYSVERVEVKRIKANTFMPQSVTPQGLSWLIVKLGDQTYLVRRSDVFYDDAAPCVYARNPVGANGTGIAGLRADTNAGAGPGGEACVPVQR